MEHGLSGKHILTRIAAASLAKLRSGTCLLAKHIRLENILSLILSSLAESSWLEATVILCTEIRHLSLRLECIRLRHRGLRRWKDALRLSLL